MHLVFVSKEAIESYEVVRRRGSSMWPAGL
jgi:hypothetical protein